MVCSNSIVIPTRLISISFTFCNGPSNSDMRHILNDDWRHIVNGRFGRLLNNFPLWPHGDFR